ncbi:MAG: hypothetical protein ACR5K4_00915 [Sodalis sp. (in: enterobacteria)]
MSSKFISKTNTITLLVSKVIGRFSKTEAYNIMESDSGHIRVFARDKINNNSGDNIAIMLVVLAETSYNSHI